MTDRPTASEKPYWYILAGIGFIPMIGIPFGLAALVRGILTFRTNGKILLVLAIASFIPMSIMYGSLGVLSQQKDGVFSKMHNSLAQRMLTESVAEIEMHKMVHGSYPDSLQSIKNNSNLSFILGKKGFHDTTYYYFRKGDKYVFGNAGPNLIKLDSDDLAPVLQDTTGLGILNAVIGNEKNIDKKRFQ